MKDQFVKFELFVYNFDQIFVILETQELDLDQMKILSQHPTEEF